MARGNTFKLFIAFNKIKEQIYITMNKIKIIRRCLICGKIFSKPLWRTKKTKYCSQACNGRSKIGDKHFAWKGGKPKCLDCGKILSSYKSTSCKSCTSKKRIWSEKTRKKIGIAHKGRKHSEESKRKMSESLKGRQVWNKGISRFKDSEDKREQENKRRRELYKLLPKEKRMADLIRNRIRIALKNYCKKSSTFILLGCDFTYFKKYLENLFKKNMNWENYGNGINKWNIDHIIPISKFDLSKEEEQKKAFHYSNCQPMWSYKNCSKGNKIY